MNVLVTGGFGFIGSHIVRRLVLNGDTVRILDNASSGASGNLGSLVDDVEIVDGDLRDEHAVAQAVMGCEVIYHQGAIPSVARSFTDPHTTMDVGVSGTLNVLLAARDLSTRRVVLASSSAVYGDNPATVKREDMKPAPLSPYALSKLAGEQLCSIFSTSFGLETVVLRYFNVFGPGQSPQSEYAAVIPTFIHKASQGEAVTIWGDGEQSRDFVFVEDVVAANVRAAELPAACGRILNIASGQAISVNQVLDLVSALVAIPVKPDFKNPRHGDIRHSLADISTAREILGYEPRFSFEEGLKQTVEAFTESMMVPSFGGARVGRTSGRLALEVV